tara:strand:+ start:38044 stop:38595 length:552 start_codon:yes stop_codon:yes gene_type:complete
MVAIGDTNGVLLGALIMPDMITISAIAIFAFILGALAGRAISRNNSSDGTSMRDMEKKLADGQESLKRYQQAVTEHFITLSHHTTNMAQSYRDIHEHLATSALRLASAEVSQQILKGAGIDPSLSDIEATAYDDDGGIEAPKDYAPKVPGGVLSEAYGLTDSIDDQAELDEHDELSDPTLKVS